MQTFNNVLSRAAVLAANATSVLCEYCEKATPCVADVAISRKRP